jgi:uncharacterized Ntn-hydrolase superfamily protein
MRRIGKWTKRSALPFLVFCVLGLPAPASAAPRAHTFSIVARDPKTGEIGVAVQSHWFSVGPIVPWAEPGVGAVATQSLVEISYGPKGLALMRGGMSAPEALRKLLADDPQREVRQVAMIDAQGRVAAHTGKQCIAQAGDQVGDQFGCQANLMLNGRVWGAMARGYREAEGDLAERLLAALEAGQSVGGDVRGQQSAAILVVRGKAGATPWNDKILDLRVEDSPEPIRELRRLVKLHRAYESASHGDDMVAARKFDEATAAYAKASDLAPGNEELLFWKAAGLYRAGQVDASLPIFRQIFEANPHWALVVTRLEDLDVLAEGEADFTKAVDRILAVAPAEARASALEEWKRSRARAKASKPGRP